MIHSGWNAVLHFYRIRPIPGVDVDSSPHAISFNDLFREFVADWRILLTGIIVGLLAAVFLVSTAPPTYEATLTVAPVESSMSDSGGSAGAGAGVLNLLGYGGSGQYGDYAQFLDMTHSVRLATRLNEKYGLMKQVFPFDKKTGAFVPPSDMVSRLARALRWMLGLPPWAPPNMVSLANFLKGDVRINHEADGTATLAHFGPTPTAAGSFLARVYQETDEYMRQDKLASHRKRLEYLGQRLSDTSSLEQRNFLIGLWGREQSQMLLLTGGDPVGARMTDDIHVPNMPQNGAALTLAMGLLFGLLTGLFVVIGRSAYRRA
jgi:hypothetical protein